MNESTLYLFSDEDLRADDPGDAGMGDGDKTVQKPEVRLVPLRGVVHGLRHRPDLHLPLLAPAGLRRFPHPVRCGFGDQPHLRDFRLLLQLQAHKADGTREGVVFGAHR